MVRSALGAPERFSSCSRLSGVQMLNAELELAARTGCLKRPQALCKRATAVGGT